MSLSESCEGQKQRTGLWVGRWGLGFLTPPQPACPEGGGERLLTLKGPKLGLQQWSKIHGRTGGGQKPQREKAKATVLEAGRWLDLGVPWSPIEASVKLPLVLEGEVLHRGDLILEELIR